ncbi:MAG: ActS/PrrB/RegB family redox-sensitive histidine kinase [Minwuiales bacterium]|nr:ActS/PrrB/RegB family redox-sensitive histidine kinase [Minwuiales bacterium]
MSSSAETGPFRTDVLAGVAAASPGEGRVRLRTLVLIRWVAVAGQAVALLLVRFGLEFEFPFVPAAGAVAFSALLNVVASLRHPTSTRLGDLGAAAYLGYDIAQLAVLLYLTGGLTNPFCVLFLVPVTISATILSLTSTVILGALAAVCISLLALFHQPLPWSTAGGLVLPMTYIFGIWAALLLGMGFTCAYAWRVAEENRRMSEALAAAQTALAREQRLSALDGLAAAAAHELGTPLSTITLVVKELARDMPQDSALAEDMALLASQTERCREILARISRDPQEDDSAFAATTLSGIVEAAAQPYLIDDINLTIEVADAAQRGAQPRVARSPEIMQGLSNLIENAADFADSEVQVKLDWDQKQVRVEVADDGPGIPSDILGALGDPYVTTRPQSGGMGLGVFIAKTLLERTGALVRFENRLGRGGRIDGAKVAVLWQRDVLEAKVG